MGGPSSVGNGDAIPPDLSSLGDVAGQEGRQDIFHADSSTTDQKTNDVGKQLTEGFPEMGEALDLEGFEFPEAGGELAGRLSITDEDLPEELRALLTLGQESEERGGNVELAANLGPEIPTFSSSKLTDIVNETDENVEALLADVEDTSDVSEQDPNEMPNLAKAIGLSNSEMAIAKTLRSDLKSTKIVTDESALDDLLPNIDQVFAKKIGNNTPDYYPVKDFIKNPKNYTVYGGYNSQEHRLFWVDSSIRDSFVAKLSLHLSSLSYQQEINTSDTKDDAETKKNKEHLSSPSAEIKPQTQKLTDEGKDKNIEQKRQGQREHAMKRHLLKEDEQKWVEAQQTKAKQTATRELKETEKKALIKNVEERKASSRKRKSHGSHS